LSNVALKVFPDLASHNLAAMLRRGLLVTCNSDDPAYFGGYISDNYIAVAAALDLDDDEIVALARNSFLASFIAPDEKERHLAAVDATSAGRLSGPNSAPDRRPGSQST
jgi:adenosine deaminase